MKKDKVAIIRGAYGQDGSLMADFLIKKGYVVHTLLRMNTLEGLLDDLQTYVESDIEIYDFAGMTVERECENDPSQCYKDNTVRPLEDLLIAFRKTTHKQRVKYFFASSIKILSDQNPNHYVKSKSITSQEVQKLRQRGLYAISGFLAKHESPHQLNTDRVLGKIIKYAVLKKTIAEDIPPLQLENTDCSFSCGDAREYIQIIWDAMQHDKPEDFTIRNVEVYHIQAYVDYIEKKLGIEIEIKDRKKCEYEQIKKEPLIDDMITFELKKYETNSI